MRPLRGDKEDGNALAVVLRAHIGAEQGSREQALAWAFWIAAMGKEQCGSKESGRYQRAETCDYLPNVLAWVSPVHARLQTSQNHPSRRKRPRQGYRRAMFVLCRSAAYSSYNTAAPNAPTTTPMTAPTPAVANGAAAPPLVDVPPPAAALALALALADAGAEGPGPAVTLLSPAALLELGGMYLEKLNVLSASRTIGPFVGSLRWCPAMLIGAPPGESVLPPTAWTPPALVTVQPRPSIVKAASLVTVGAAEEEERSVKVLTSGTVVRRDVELSSDCATRFLRPWCGKFCSAGSWSACLIVSCQMLSKTLRK